MFKKKGSVATPSRSSTKVHNDTELAMLQAKDPLSWSVSDVAKWLVMIECEEYKKVFIENCISGSELFTLEEDDLVSIGVLALGHRKKLLKSIKNLSRENEGAYRDLSDKSSESEEAVHVAATDKVTFKCSAGDDVRIIQAKSDITLSKLKALVKKEFGKSYSLSYHDLDGDNVALKKDKHLTDAIAMSKGGALKLVLKTRSRKALTSAETSILESLVDSVIVIEKDGKIIFVNGSAEKLLGYEREELVHQKVNMLMNPSDAAKHDSYIQKYLATGVAKIIGRGHSVMAKSKTGKLLPVWLSVSETKRSGRHTFTGTLHPIDSTHRSLGSSDITSDSGVENVLKMHFTILDSLLDASILINNKGVIQYFNKPASEIFGYLSSDVIGKNIKMLMPNPESDNHDTYLSNYQSTGKSKIIGKGRDVIGLNKEGAMIPLHLAVTEHAVGGSRFFVGTIRLNETRPEGKTLLQEVREVIDNLVTPGIVIEERGTIQAFNQAACKILGYSLVEVVGKNVKILMPSPHSDNHDQYLRNYLTTGIRKIIGLERQLVARTKTGNLLPIILSVTEKTDGQKRVFIGILRPVE